MERSSEKSFNHATGKTAVEDARKRATRMVKEQAFFEDKAGQYRGQLHSGQMHEKLDLDRKHSDQKSAQSEKLNQFYGKDKAETRDQIKQLKDKAAKSRLNNAERERGKALQRNLADVQTREKEQRDALAKKQAAEKQELDDKHKAQDQAAERTVHFARQQRQAAGWKPAPVIFDASKGKDSDMSFQKPVRDVGGGESAQIAPKSVEGAPRPSLTPRGVRRGNLKPISKDATPNLAGKGSHLDF